MFAELPKLFDRNFAMAFFLPFVAFMWLFVEVLSIFGMGMNLISFVQVDLVVRTGVLFLVSWLGGILLLVTNQGLYRTLEGYGTWNPLRLLKVFKWIERIRYKRLLRRIAGIDKRYLKALREGVAISPEDRETRNKLMRTYAKRFPHKEEFLLPTAFGNTIRAFEVYPTVMYGIEAIDGWSRLLAVTPGDYRELMDNAKAHVDFWVNIGFLSLILLLEYLSYAIYFRTLPSWWIAVLLSLSTISSPKLARNSAVAWGDYVKSAFDMFGSTMREMLVFEMPKNRAEEVKQWTGFSQAIVYRRPDLIPELKIKSSTPKYISSGAPKRKKGK